MKSLCLFLAIMAFGISTAYSDLSWCPSKKSANSHHSGRLRIASWNLGNLHALNDQSVYPKRGRWPASVKRSSEDYNRIKCYIRMFDPDILAVQEVDGENALKRIIDGDIYNIHVSKRPKGSLNGKQNTGFAFKKGIKVEKLEDLETLDVRGDKKLRYGTQLRISHKDRNFMILSVHMISGCFENDSSGRACTTLFKQLPKLEDWIDIKAKGDEPYIILGDFNRIVNNPNDRFWIEIDDAEPANADLTSVTQNKSISCRDNKYKKFIDHIVFDKRSWNWVEESSFRHITYRQADKDVWDKISDHCPISVDLWVN